LGPLLLPFVQDEEDTAELRERLSGFTHRCRNLLNGMKMSLYFVRREANGPLPRPLTEVEHTYGSIEHLFDQLQQIYRPMTLTPVCAEFGSLVGDRERGWREAFARGGAVLDVVPPSREVRGEFDPSYLSLGLDGFVSWRAASLAINEMARLTWRSEGRDFVVAWEETQGPSGGHLRDSPSAEAQASGLQATNRSLAMPLLARIMTAHRGVMEWTSKPGFRVLLRWPLAQQARIENAP